MGFISIAALKAEQVEPASKLDILGEVTTQINYTPHYSTPLSRVPQKVLQEPAMSSSRGLKLMAKMLGEKGVYTCPHWHTSGEGTLILTSDYIINLFGYLAFKPTPDNPADSEDLTGEALVDKMATYYRKQLIKARASAKNNGCEKFISKRKLVKHDPAAELALPQSVVADSDITGFIWVNFDCIHGDQNSGNKQLTGEQWLSLIHEARHQAPGDTPRKGESVGDYQSILDLVSVGQQDIVIAQYDHLHAFRSARLTRNRRTPPEALYPDHLEFNEKVGLSLAWEYPLMREFFASQGVTIQL